MALQDAFDVIVLEMAGMSSSISGFQGRFTHERSPENDYLTAALFAANTLGAEGLRAFYEKGGRFTDQCNRDGMDARMILQQRLYDGIEEGVPLQAQKELRENLVVFEELVIKQGGLIHIVEKGPFRSQPPTRGRPNGLEN